MRAMARSGLGAAWDSSITEWFVLEGSSECCLIPLPALSRFTHSSISAQSPVQPDHGCVQGWGTSTFLGLQCLTSVSVNNFFLIPSINLPSLSLKPFPLVLSPAKESVPFLSTAPSDAPFTSQERKAFQPIHMLHVLGEPGLSA